MSRSKLTAAGMAALLVLSVFASMPVAAQEESVSVETLSPIKVTEDKAELEGNLTALANASEATVWFEYWPEGDSGNATATENLTVSSVGTFVIDAKDLESNTTYIAQAHAATENASDNGTLITFTTESEPPLAVSTEAPTNVTNTSATFHGALTRLDGVDSADVWFEYWALGDRRDADTTAIQTLGAPGPFNASVDDLEPGTTYFVQAHGEADNETVAGAAVKFETQTDPRPLGVETEDASGVTNDSATLNGELTGLGGEDSADVWFEYWQQGDSANTTTTTANDTLDDPGAFSADVSGLANNTTYVYVAHAAANNTTATGDEVEFMTGAAGDAGPTWDGEGPFGQWVRSWLENLITDPGNNTILGQTVSEIVTANNPGSEHRSDEANPGGNASGPPEHAGPPEDDGNETEQGPPEDPGPSDDGNSTDDGNESGPPDDAGPPDDKGNESEDSGPPEDANPPDDDGNETERGPPDHADDEDEDDEADEEDEDAEDDEADDENGNDESDEADGEEEADDGQDSGEDDGNGPPDDSGPDDDNGQGNR